MHSLFFLFFLGSFSPTFLVFYFYVTHAHVSNLLFIVYPPKNRLLFINACFAYSKSNSLWPFHVQRHWLLSLKPPSTQKEEERMKDWGGYPTQPAFSLYLKYGCGSSPTTKNYHTRTVYVVLLSQITIGESHMCGIHQMWKRYSICLYYILFFY